MIYYNKNSVEKAQEGIAEVMSGVDTNIITNSTEAYSKLLKIKSGANALEKEQEYERARQAAPNVLPIGYDAIENNDGYRDYPVYRTKGSNWFSRGVTKAIKNVSDPDVQGVFDLNKGSYRYIESNEGIVGGNHIIGGTFIPNLDEGGSDGDNFNLASVFRARDNGNTYYGTTSSGGFKIGKIADFADSDRIVRVFNGSDRRPPHTSKYNKAVVNGSDLRVYRDIWDNETYTDTRGADIGQRVAFQAVGNDWGKIIVYSPTTGANELIYGPIQHIVDAMNTFKAANPDAYQISIDNGTFRDVVGSDKETLSPGQYDNWWNQDERYQNGIGYTLVRTN